MQTENNVIASTILKTINNFENVAKVAAYKSIVHSSMVKTIVLIRNYLKNNAETRDAVLADAKKMHLVYKFAVAELETIKSSKWDDPLSVEDMLSYMSSRIQKADPEMLSVMSDITAIDVKTIALMDETIQKKEQEQLIADTPQIIHLFTILNSPESIGHIKSIDQIDVVNQLHILLKVVEGLNKAVERALSYVLRSRSLRNIADIPIIKACNKELYTLVETFEKAHKDEIVKAISEGRNVRLSEDVKPI